jgi:hypothetical protein
MDNENCRNALRTHKGNLSFETEKEAARLSRAALETAALTLGETTPDSKALVMRERVFEALLADIA